MLKVKVNVLALLNSLLVCSCLQISYSWASSLNYVVVLALVGNSAGCNTPKYEFVLKKNALNTNGIQHHLLLEDTICCYNQPVTLDKVGLYLAPSAFLRPSDTIVYEEPKHSSKHLLSLMAYINDHSGFLQNPTGELKSSVKHHIRTLASSLQVWKSRFQSNWSKYILRRYCKVDNKIIFH
jgi:hypothetical protein